MTDEELRRTYPLAVAQYTERWAPADAALYDLCRRRYPGHDVVGHVAAKVLVVGRTYASQVERQIVGNGQVSSMDMLIDRLHERHVAVDRIIGTLRGLRGPLDPVVLSSVATQHGRFMEAVEAILTPRQAQTTSPTPRSFASKYLHFHCPLVPIFDSIASRTATQQCRMTRALRVFAPPRGSDGIYYEYLLRFLHIFNRVAAAGLRPTVRHVDWFLIFLSSRGLP